MCLIACCVFTKSFLQHLTCGDVTGAHLRALANTALDKSLIHGAGGQNRDSSTPQYTSGCVVQMICVREVHPVVFLDLLRLSSGYLAYR